MWGNKVFEECGFLMGEGDQVVIVIPALLPEAETYTVSISDKSIRFKAGYNSIAEMHYPGGEIFRRLTSLTQVGLVEYPPGWGDFPGHITNVAYIEVRRAA
jgi:hypothetical protein